MNKERDITLDIAKGVSILLMTITHLNLFTNFPTLQFINKEYFVLIKMPLFIFISGLLFTNKSSFKDFFISKFDSLIKPVITISIIIFIVAIILSLGNNAIKETLMNSKYFLFGNIYPLWFPIALFITLVIFKLLITVKFQLPKSYLFSSTILILLALSLLNQFNLEIYIFKFHSILYFLLIFALGYLAQKRNWLSFLFDKSIFALSSIVFFTTISLRHQLLIEVDLNMNSFGNLIPTFLMMLSGIIVILNIAKIISKSFILSQILAKCSYSSFFILALHILIGNEILYPVLKIFLGDNNYTAIITFILTIISCCSIHKLIFNLKYINYLLLPIKSIKTKKV